jgi:hypothetical protein
VVEGDARHRDQCIGAALSEAAIVAVSACGEGADRSTDEGEAFGVEYAFEASAAVSLFGDGQAAGFELVLVAGGLGLGVGVAFPGVEQHA